MSDKKSTIPDLDRNDFYELEYLDGWERIDGTLEVDGSPRWINWESNVYRYEGKLYLVTVPVNTGDGDSAESYDPSIIEVFPWIETVTIYKSVPQPCLPRSL